MSIRSVSHRFCAIHLQTGLTLSPLIRIGNTPLCASIATYCGTDYENIIVGNGSTELISLFIQIEHPKKALVIGPTYSEYEREIALGGGTTLYYPLKEKDDFRLDVDDFISHLNENIDLLVVCNPNNPTSSCITQKEYTYILLINFSRSLA